MARNFHKRNSSSFSRSWKPRGGEYIPSMAEISWAKEHGMEPDEYVSALKAAEDYDRKIAQEARERRGY